MRGEPRSSEGERIVSLYRELGPAVYRLCLRMLGDRESARDATQEVFVKLVRDMDRLEDPESALPWLCRVATNHCLNVIRDARRPGVWAGDGALDAVPDPPPSHPDRQLARQVLSRFDLQTQAIAVGILVEGMGRGEVAAELGISRRTVHRKLHRFLHRARALVGRDEP